jgi:hypothetical protein
MSNFFDYYCEQCDAPFCERVHLMNLALDYVETEYCLPCLAQELEQTPESLSAFVWEYICARDCFRNPWQQFNATTCPKIEESNCFCQREIS